MRNYLPKLSRALKQIFKQPCILCGGGESCKLGLCEVCFIDLPRCPPVDLNQYFKRHIVEVRALVAALWYQSEVTYWMKQFKFKGQTKLAEDFGSLVAAQVIHFYCQAKLKLPDMIIPVAMTPFAQTLRGYNQAELLAHEVGQVLGIPVIQAVRRKHQKKKAHTLNAEERLAVLNQSFERVVELSKGSRVALVDDVITTGATLNAIAALFPAGVLIDAWAVAFTPPPQATEL